MDRREFIREVGLGAAALAFFPLASLAAEKRKRPNVLLIVCDDLNDYVNGFNGHPQARTPHLAEFAETATSFVHAYSNDPICAPSRSSFLTGIYPHKSGNFFFRKWYENPVLRNSHTLMEYFRLNGYYVVGSGKLMHHLRREEWSDFQYPPDYGPFWYEDGKRVAHPKVPEPYRSIGPVDGSFGALEDVPPPAERKKGAGWIYGQWGQIHRLRLDGPNGRDPTPDERNAAWAVQEIQKLERSSSGKPFFLGVGFIRPHTPLHVPKKYFDMFPLEKVKLPVLKVDDAAAFLELPPGLGRLVLDDLSASGGGLLLEDAGGVPSGVIETVLRLGHSPPFRARLKPTRIAGEGGAVKVGARLEVEGREALFYMSRYLTELFLKEERSLSRLMGAKAPVRAEVMRHGLRKILHYYGIVCRRTAKVYEEGRQLPCRSFMRGLTVQAARELMAFEVQGERHGLEEGREYTRAHPGGGQVQVHPR